MSPIPSQNMIPPGKNPVSTTTIVNGRPYTCANGGVLTGVPYQDADELEANGWMKGSVGGSGVTSARPTSLSTGAPLPYGYRFLDLTLGYEVVFDGVVWRNPTTGASV